MAIYGDCDVIPLHSAAQVAAEYVGEIDLPEGDDILPLLPPLGSISAEVEKVVDWVDQHAASIPESIRFRHDEVELLRPVASPSKLLLLAGNYNDHLQEGGQSAVQRTTTFPYVFMKPSTTLQDPGKPVVLPSASPDQIVWELELGVVIGRAGRHIPETDALGYVAGYTVINDVSDRGFRPNPNRVERDGDHWFDWLHGKWHDTFCPFGPCIAAADSLDPQNAHMTLTVNGETMQDSCTSQQVFSVAALISFISSMVTLNKGDLIATGTPGGVGSAGSRYLRPGDRMAGLIAGIGTLVNPCVAEE